MMVKRLPSPWNFFSVNLIWSNRRHNSSLNSKKETLKLYFVMENWNVMQFFVRWRFWNLKCYKANWRWQSQWKRESHLKIMMLLGGQLKKVELLNGGCKWRSTFQDDNLWNEIFLFCSELESLEMICWEGFDHLSCLFNSQLPLNKNGLLLKFYYTKFHLEMGRWRLLNIISILTIYSDFLRTKWLETPWIKILIFMRFLKRHLSILYRLK